MNVLDLCLRLLVCTAGVEPTSPMPLSSDIGVFPKLSTDVCRFETQRSNLLLCKCMGYTCKLVGEERLITFLTIMWKINITYSV